MSGGASLKGANVGIYLNGKGSVIRFDADTRIDLTAPKDGILAGILFYEDRTSPLNQKHEILSNDAKVLLGTIYLPQNELNIAANKPVAAESAYTIVVARRFTLSAGPTNGPQRQIFIDEYSGPRGRRPRLHRRPSGTLTRAAGLAARSAIGGPAIADEGIDLVCADRRREQIALQQVAAGDAQELLLGQGFDALRHNLQPQRPRQGGPPPGRWRPP